MMDNVYKIRFGSFCDLLNKPKKTALSVNRSLGKGVYQDPRINHGALLGFLDRKAVFRTVFNYVILCSGSEKQCYSVT